MLPYDPVPWLMAQEGLSALRARRRLGLERAGDDLAVAEVEVVLSGEQGSDGSFADSPMRTAGVLDELSDLRGRLSEGIIDPGASFLFSVLAAQSGYARAQEVAPGSLTDPCDLCGFFGPYEARADADVIARGAREMNHYREFEPLLGPSSPVRSVRRSSYDRVGPTSCYTWGLIPLCYTIEALCRAGYSDDPRLEPAVDALLGAQRESGGWCRNLGGHPTCSLHAVRAVGVHPRLRLSMHAERALRFMRAAQGSWRGNYLFAAAQAVARFDQPMAGETIREAFYSIAGRQRRDGAFGGAHAVEKVAAALVAMRALGGKATR